MEVRAVAKFIRVQPRKVRIVAAEVKGKPAQAVADVLRFHPSKGAFHLRKVLVSAIANAVENNQADPRDLTVSKVQVDEGPRLKRIIARSMGRANRVLKKMSHITVYVSDEVVVEDERAGLENVGTVKAKPRPSLSKPSGKKKGGSKPATSAPEAVAEEAVEEVTDEVVAEAQPEVAPAASPAEEEKK